MPRTGCTSESVSATPVTRHVPLPDRYNDTAQYDGGNVEGDGGLWSHPDLVDDPRRPTARARPVATDGGEPSR
jgi:hypothetical protein